MKGDFLDLHDRWDVDKLIVRLAVKSSVRAMAWEQRPKRSICSNRWPHDELVVVPVEKKAA